MNSIMSIEEKAKAYDEAKARMIKACNDNRCSLYFMNEIFSEHDESEDERIRKTLIEYFNAYPKDYYGELKKGDILSFLKNQKPINDTDDDMKLTIIQFLEYASSYGCPDILSKEKAKTWIAWLEKQGNIDKASYEIAEKEKYDFVNGQFIQCRKSFDGFKEYNSYWFEYVGNDTYVGRSDNILNKKFHITPRQLYRLFTQQHYCSKENNEFEKQGEEPADKVEPKFKVGDWVVNNITKDVFLIKSVNSGYCTLEDVKGNIISPCLPQCESESHLWTIQDAKDGDVLFKDLMGGMTFIFDGVNPEMAILYSFIINNDGGEVANYNIGKPNTGIGYVEENKNIIHPATKEQRDLLFQKMKESGYEWDADKKELKKSQRMISAEAKEALYNKPDWSEEDDTALCDALWCCKQAASIAKNENDMGNIWYAEKWLKSLKGRMKGE